MKHSTTVDQNFIDQFTNFEDLNKRMPNKLLTDHVGAVDGMRRMHREIGVLGKMQNTMGWTRNHSMKRVASIPSPVLGAILRIDPEFMKSKEKFYRWLKNHPEYSLEGKVGA